MGATGVGAFGNPIGGAFNDTGQDPSYGPYNVEFRGVNYNYCCQQVIQAEQSNITWSDGNANNVAGRYDHLGPVFHVFNYQTNCPLPFNYDGAWELDLPSPWIVPRDPYRNCGYQGYNAEVRFYFSAGDAPGIAWNGKYAGAEFQISDGDAYWNGRGVIANDIYFNGSAPWDEVKDNLPSWCFEPDGGAFGC